MMEELIKLVQQGSAGLLVISLGVNAFLFKLLLKLQNDFRQYTQDQVSKADDQNRVLTEAYKTTIDALKK